MVSTFVTISYTNAMELNRTFGYGALVLPRVAHLESCMYSQWLQRYGSIPLKVCSECSKSVHGDELKPAYKLPHGAGDLTYTPIIW